MRRFAICAGLMLCLVMSISAAKKRNWQSGQLTSVAAVPISGKNKAGQTYYIVESPSTVYTFTTPKPAKLNLTVGRAVQFAIEKDDVYLLDDRGKEVNLRIVEAVEKTPQKPAR